MLLVNALVLTFSLFFTCEAAYEDTLPKCSINDGECMKALYSKVLQDIGSTGLPELNVPPLDPIEIKNMSLNIIDSVKITINDGVAKGLSKCVYNKFTAEIEKHKGRIDFTCDLLTVKGHFTISGESPVIQSAIGGSNVNGDGKAKIKLNKLHMTIDFPFYPIKRGDNTYMHIESKKLKYKYDIENAHFVTENIVIGNNDISQLVSSYLNSNWRMFLKTSGSVFFDTALDFCLTRINNFCDSVPTSKYIIEDLNQYI